MAFLLVTDNHGTEIERFHHSALPLDSLPIEVRLALFRALSSDPNDINLLDGLVPSSSDPDAYSIDAIVAAAPLNIEGVCEDCGMAQRIVRAGEGCKRCGGQVDTLAITRVKAE